MILCDVNIFVYAYREDAQNHKEYHQWLNNCINSDQPYGVSSLVLSGFLRMVTNSRIFELPSPLSETLEFVKQIRHQPNCVHIDPGPRHWDIFADLCEKANAKGNLIPDAYFAALAIESGSEWITTDRDYSRFPGLKWRHPLDA